MRKTAAIRGAAVVIALPMTTAQAMDWAAHNRSLSLDATASRQDYREIDEMG